MLSKKSVASLASSFALAIGLTGCGETIISADSAFCVIDDSAKYPVRVVAADDGRVLREGGYKRFEIDRDAGTCTYRTSDDAFRYKMKP